jgi:hypothetical protein
MKPKKPATVLPVGSVLPLNRACDNRKSTHEECTERTKKRETNLQCSLAGNSLTDELAPTAHGTPHRTGRLPDLGIPSNEKQRPVHEFSRIPVYGRTPTKLQTKLTVNVPGDVYEQEAEEVADNFVRELPRQPLRFREITVLIGLFSGRPQTSLLHRSRHRSWRRFCVSPGSRLDADTRTLMGPHFGRDFSQVRVHSGATAEQSARDVSATAYTVGHHIVFDSGRFAPTTHEGQRLLAHELAHVVQQSGVGGTSRGPSTGEQTQVERRLSPTVQRYGHDVESCTKEDLTKRLWPGDALAWQFVDNAIAELRSERGSRPSPRIS